VINRMPSTVRSRRRAQGEMEFFWDIMAEPQKTATNGSMLTHVLYDHYTWPAGLNVELGPDQPSKAAIQQQARLLASTALRRARAYRTPHVLFLLGDDFRFASRQEWTFARVDALVEALQHDMPVWASYSTPSHYFAQILPLVRQQKSFPRFSGSFLPYSDTFPAGENTWTGYYASRPNLKALVQETNSAVAAAERLRTLLALAPDQHLPGGASIAGASSVYASRVGTSRAMAAELNELLIKAQREETSVLGPPEGTLGGALTLPFGWPACSVFFVQVALAHHHDAITGTCTNLVAEDYANRLRQSARLADVVATVAARHLLQCVERSVTSNRPTPGTHDKLEDAQSQGSQWKADLLAYVKNMEAVEVQLVEDMVAYTDLELAVFNSLPWMRTEVVRLPLVEKNMSKCVLVGSAAGEEELAPTCLPTWQRRRLATNPGTAYALAQVCTAVYQGALLAAKHVFPASAPSPDNETVAPTAPSPEVASNMRGRKHGSGRVRLARGASSDARGGCSFAVRRPFIFNAVYHDWLNDGAWGVGF
ncbi:hypothetical protein CYMTET_52067, partial [Cymbomonas tetramitiformis]